MNRGHILKCIMFVVKQEKGPKKFLPVKQRIILFNASIKPILEYCVSGLGCLIASLFHVPIE